MKHIIKILFVGIMLLVCIGYYFKNTGDHSTGDRCIGIGVLLLSFVLMPLFIFHRWKNKSVKDYMLTEENIRQLNEYEDKKTEEE